MKEFWWAFKDNRRLFPSTLNLFKEFIYEIKLYINRIKYWIDCIRKDMIWMKIYNDKHK